MFGRRRKNIVDDHRFLVALHSAFSNNNFAQQLTRQIEYKINEPSTETYEASIGTSEPWIWTSIYGSRMADFTRKSSYLEYSTDDSSSLDENSSILSRMDDGN